MVRAELEDDHPEVLVEPGLLVREPATVISFGGPLQQSIERVLPTAGALVVGCKPDPGTFHARAAAGRFRRCNCVVGI
jgi:hypothetical protein